ncbi:MAG: hypothetical protein FH748_16490 [Balneolaceae bacterium]|nr:hypothetical protein [Balneolaceae bacterium]
MDKDELNVLLVEAEPLLGSGINIIKRKPNNEEKIIPCTFKSISKNGVELFEDEDKNISKGEMSYSPKGILESNDSKRTIYKFPLKMVIKAIKNVEPINEDFFEQTKNKKD